MKFTSYQSNAQLGTPASQVSNIHYSNPGAMALAKAEGDMYNTIGKGMMTFADKVSSAKALEANNYYNQRMSEESNSLMNNHKEGEALNITELYDQKQKAVLEETQKKYGSYIKFGSGAQAFQEYTMRDNATRRSNMQKYQMGEAEKFENTQYNNGLATCAQMMFDQGCTDAGIEGAIARANTLAATRFAAYGNERVMAEQRKIAGDLAGNALQIALKTGDDDRVKILAGKYGDVLDNKLRMEALAIAGKRQLATMDLLERQRFFNKYGANATPEQLRNAFLEEAGKGGYDLARVFAMVDDKGQPMFDGARMDNGPLGCAEFATKFLAAAGDSFGKQELEKGIVYVPAVLDDARAAGIKVDEKGNIDTNTIKAGDLLVTSTKADDDMAHIVVADGNGGYYGNSTALEAGVHRDGYDGLGTIHYVIRTGKNAGSGISPLDLEKKVNEQLKYNSQQYQIYQQQQHRTLDDAEQQLRQAIMANGADNNILTDEQANSIIAGLLTGDEKTDTKLQWLARSFTGTGNGRRTRGSGSGNGVGNATAFKYDFIEAVKQQGNYSAARADLEEAYALNMISPKDYETARGVLEDFKEKKGAFAIKGLSSIRSTVKAQLGKDVDDATITMALDAAIAQDEAKYAATKQHLSPKDMATAAVNAVLDTVEISTPNADYNADSWWSRYTGNPYSSQEYSTVQLREYGLDKVTVKPDGNYAVVVDGKSVTATPEQMGRIFNDGEDWRDVLFRPGKNKSEEE